MLLTYNPHALQYISRSVRKGKSIPPVPYLRIQTCVSDDTCRVRILQSSSCFFVVLDFWCTSPASSRLQPKAVLRVKESPLHFMKIAERNPPIVRFWLSPENRKPLGFFYVFRGLREREIHVCSLKLFFG